MLCPIFLEAHISCAPGNCHLLHKNLPALESEAALGDGELKEHGRDPELLGGNLVFFLRDVGLRILPLKWELKWVADSNVNGLTTTLSCR